MGHGSICMCTEAWGGSVISARFILARTTADKSNGRSVSGPKGEEGMFHFAGLLDDAQIRASLVLHAGEAGGDVCG